MNLSHDDYYFSQAVKWKRSVNRPYDFPGNPGGQVAFVPANVIRGIFCEVKVKIQHTSYVINGEQSIL